MTDDPFAAGRRAVHASCGLGHLRIAVTRSPAAPCAGPRCAAGPASSAGPRRDRRPAAARAALLRTPLALGDRLGGLPVEGRRHPGGAALLGHRAHHDRPPRLADPHLDDVPGADVLRRLHPLGVQAHSAAHDGLCRHTAGLVEPRGPEPPIDPDALHRRPPCRRTRESRTPAHRCSRNRGSTAGWPSSPRPAGRRRRAR